MRTPRGALVEMLPLSVIQANKRLYDIDYKGAGEKMRIRCAKLKQRRSLSELSNDGTAFLQVLPSGHCVYALKGTTGSGRASTLVDEAN